MNTNNDHDLIDLNESPLHNILYFFDPLIKNIDKFDSKIPCLNSPGLSQTPIILKEKATQIADVEKFDKLNSNSNVIGEEKFPSLTIINDPQTKSKKHFYIYKLIESVLKNNDWPATNFSNTFRFIVSPNGHNENNIFIHEDVYTYLPAVIYTSPYYFNVYSKTTFKITIWFSCKVKTTFTCSGSNTTAHLIEQALCSSPGIGWTDASFSSQSQLNIFDDNMKKPKPSPQLYVLMIKDRLDVLDIYLDSDDSNNYNLNSSLPIAHFDHIQSCLKTGNEIDLHLEKVALKKVVKVLKDDKVEKNSTAFTTRVQYIAYIESICPFLYLKCGSHTITSQNQIYHVDTHALAESLTQSFASTIELKLFLEKSPPPNVDSIRIIITDTIDILCKRLLEQSSQTSGPALYSTARALCQAVKAAITLLGCNVEENELCLAQSQLLSKCHPHYIPNVDDIKKLIWQIRELVIETLNMCLIDYYGETSYHLFMGESSENIKDKQREPILTTDINEFFSITIKSLHNVPNFKSYGYGSYFEVGLGHGTKLLETKKVYFKNEDGSINASFHDNNLSQFNTECDSNITAATTPIKHKIVLNYEIHFETRVSMLPRETFIRFIIHPNQSGQPSTANSHNTGTVNNESTEVRVIGTGVPYPIPMFPTHGIGCELFRNIFYLFDLDGKLIRGNRLIAFPTSKDMPNNDNLTSSSLPPSIQSSISLNLLQQHKSPGTIVVNPLFLQFKLNIKCPPGQDVIFPPQVPSQINPSTFQTDTRGRLDHRLLLTFHDDFNVHLGGQDLNYETQNVKKGVKSDGAGDLVLLINTDDGRDSPTKENDGELKGIHPHQPLVPHNCQRVDKAGIVELDEVVRKHFALLPLSTDDKERVWVKRLLLIKSTRYSPSLCVPLVIRSADHSWAWSNLIHIYDFLFYPRGTLPKSKYPSDHVIKDLVVGEKVGENDNTVPEIDIYASMYLLLPDFPDLKVRSMAVHNIDRYDTDTLIFHLPQLITLLLKSEPWIPDIIISPSDFNSTTNLSPSTYDRYYTNSPLLKLLLTRSISNPRFASYFAWNLVPWFPHSDPYRGRHHQGACQVTLALLTTLMGSEFELVFDRTREFLCASLPQVGQALKRSGLHSKDESSTSNALTLLKNRLERLNERYFSQAGSRALVRLPLEPGFSVARLVTEQRGANFKGVTSTFYKSKNLPIKLVFENGIISDHPSLANTAEPYVMIYKAGDDLRQDQFALQMIKLMDRLWLSENLDLNMITFGCVPLNDNEGVIEYINKAETLRNIQMNYGLSGSFKSQCIYEWLKKFNTLELDFKKALRCFTRSCAGYCVATYMLGICDRHNDNIMIKRSGHLVHIDFGKFLGDSQMFGNVKRDRVPFVLTPDMAYVINQGTQGTTKFQTFIDLCCEAFNILRKNGNKLLIMMKVTVYAGIPGVPPGSVDFLRKTLALELSETQATVRFTKLIKESLSSKFTQFNFFIHGLMQSKEVSNNRNDPIPQLNELVRFSFTNNPLTRSDEQDCIKTVTIGSAIQKLYDLEKLYVYLCQIQYHQSPAPAIVYRTYAEFCELRSKLTKTFALAQFPALPTSIFASGSRLNFNLNLNIPSSLTTSYDGGNDGLIMDSGHTTIPPSSSGVVSVHRRKRYQVAVRGLPYVQRFVRALFKMAPEVCQSTLVLTFFQPILRDQREFKADESADVFPRPTSSYHQVGLEIDQGDVGVNDRDLPYLVDIQMKVNLRLRDEQVGKSGANHVEKHSLEYNELEPELRNNHADDLSFAALTSSSSLLCPTTPKLKLSLCFKSDETTTEFQVLIMHGKNLFKKDGTLPDPFVKLWLKPDREKTTKRKTQIAFRTSHPSFNDAFVFEESLETLRTKVLFLAILSFERFKENEVIGIIYLPLKNLEINRTFVSWFSLKVD